MQDSDWLNLLLLIALSLYKLKIFEYGIEM